MGLAVDKKMAQGWSRVESASPSLASLFHFPVLLPGNKKLKVQLYEILRWICCFPQKGKVQNKTLPEAQQTQVIESLTNSVNNSVDAAVDQCCVCVAVVVDVLSVVDQDKGRRPKEKTFLNGHCPFRGGGPQPLPGCFGPFFSLGNST